MPTSVGRSVTAATDFLGKLNPQQRAAAEHFSGPLLVVAGAGTGKTKTLAARVAALIQGGAAADRILLLTFTRRAATEMVRRAGQVVGEEVTRAVWGGTFHSVAHRILRMYNQTLGLGTSFTVMDQGDAEDLLQLIRTDLDLHQTGTRFPQKSTLLACYSRCVNANEPLDQVLEERFPWCLPELEGIKQIFQVVVVEQVSARLTWATRSPAASSMSSSTSTRTPTPSRVRSCRSSGPG
jgi:DNA helicase-2/ATP-dependent DNA helicase PcrA